MLKTALSCAAFFAFTSAAFAQSPPRAEDFGSRTPRTGAPRSFQLQSSVDIEPDRFFTTYRTILGLAADVEMVPIGESTPFGEPLSYTRFQQHYLGYPVMGADFTLTHEQDKTFGGVGRIINTLAAVPGVTGRQFRFGEQAALNVVLAEITRRTRIPTASIIQNRSTVTRVIAPQGVNYAANNYRTAYRVVLYTNYPLNTYYGDVDAVSGALLRLFEVGRTQFIDLGVDGMTTYYGSTSFVAQTDTNGIELDRLAMTAPFFVETFDFENVHPPDPRDLAFLTGRPRVTDSDSDGVFNDPQDHTGVSAHWAAQSMFQYLQDFHAFQGIGSSPATAWVNYVRWGQVDNAFFFNFPDGRFGGVFGDGTAPQSSPSVDFDSVAHEIGHGVQHQLTPFPDFTGERGAIGESFADILAVAASFQYPETMPDWTMGELSSSVSFRNLAAPKSSVPPNANAYGGQHWIDPILGPDEGGVHFNCGIQNYWFSLLAQGGTGSVNDLGVTNYEVVGIGVEPAMKIVRATMPAIPTSGNFADSVNQSLLAAWVLYGQYSQQFASVHNAWHAVDMIPQPYVDNLYTSPAINELDVEPWETVFHFQPIVAEVDWEIEISEQSDFSGTTQIHRYQEQITDFSLGPLVETKVLLAPGRTYYWRARGNLPNKTEMGGWRPARMFTTDDMAPHLISPTTGATTQQPVHPWNLELKWVKPTIETRLCYDVEVYTDQTLIDAIHKFECVEPAFWDNEVDVGVDSLNYWRVRMRPLNQNGDLTNVGAWSGAVFYTTMPQVQQIAPVHASLVYPWKVTFRWQTVVGAETYILEIAHDRNGFHPNGSWDKIILSQKEDEPSQTFDADLVPQMTEDHVPHPWRVRVFGPDLQVLGEQEGDPSAEWQAINDGTATVPMIDDIESCFDLDPSIDSCPILHVDVGDDLELRWTHRLHAEAYRVEVYKFGADGSTFWADFNSPIFSAVVPRDDSDPTHQSFAVPGGEIIPENGDLTHGLYYVVRSVGPDALLSPVKHISFDQHMIEPGYSGYGEFVQLLDPPPTEPYIASPVLPSGNVMLLDGGTHVNVRLDQDPLWSPTDVWELEVHDDSSCGDLRTTYGVHWTSVGFYVTYQPNQSGSIRIRVQGLYPTFYADQANDGWSACVSFHTATKAELVDEYCGNGTQESFEDCDDGNTTDGDGCNAECTHETTVYDCGSPVVGGGEEGLDSYVVELGSSTGGFWISWDTATIPDQLIVEYENNPIHQTDCIGTQDPACSGDGCAGYAWVDLPPSTNGTTYIEVTVVPHCDNFFSGDTIWAFVVQCPDNGQQTGDPTSAGGNDVP
jgi:cysteine-rich repeat protein